MSNKIGRFEILSEIAHSDITSVYKANDPESGQTVALKTIKLEPLGDQAATLVKNLLEEIEASKVLNSHNIALLNGGEEVDGVFCASLEYVQGNSVATMLARKEGFSIWDLQDIARQTCQGLDHAHAKGLAHYTLEPAKIMVSWDGTVKILGFGISTMSAFAAQASGKPPGVLNYMSPEQLRGDPLAASSNIFTLGAIFYEMVTERKAFDGEDADQVRQSISEVTPTAPDQFNRKIHPALSQVIMKALAKAPEERYQSGQDLVNDLERCKESATKAAAAAKPGQPAQKAPVPPKAVPAVSKPTLKPAASAATSQAKPATKPVAPTARMSAPASPPPQARSKEVTEPPAAKAAAAAAGRSGNSANSVSAGLITPNLDQAAPVINTPAEAAIETFSVETFSGSSATMSSAAIIEPEIEAPKINVDPMMAENRQAGASASRSFSEIDELPPLKEVYVAPPPPPPAHEPAPHDAVHATVFKSAPPEKPRVQPREVAKKAVAEIKKTPPKLFMVSIAGAIGVILLIVAAMAWHIHSENADDEVSPAQPPVSASAQPNRNAAATQAQAAPQTPAQVAPEMVTAEPHAVSVQPKYNNKKKAKPRPAPPAIVPGQLSLASTPAGAQIQIDGQNNSAWVTPFNLTGLNPGRHTLTISKSGYAPESRNIDVASGSKSFISVQLAQLTATVSVTGDPIGAAIWMDGKDTGRVTPAQFSVDKPGNHSFIFKKQGYLEETTTVNLQIGQTFRLSPSLRVLGNTDDIKIGGKFKKLFGGSEVAGMGAVSVKTQPKGAQVAVNNRILDKLSPVDLHLDPGTYVVDITLSGFKSVHRVINVEKNGKVSIEESLDRQ
jgi:serine/threonine protein kinase